ncbi:N-acetylglucosamine kinase [Candidatus Odyssella thessalonicensis]|uniref:N-acetylglucosamine kinase n=1 Tax=Candidatus Odyssella thessalonicensis TaxID=84647 RepID=UPI000225BB1C|nr:BadF/BadG/BcrA/BcrD ATPase family protein [Candidatus Odyssella thessalonicensis]
MIYFKRKMRKLVLLLAAHLISPLSLMAADPSLKEAINGADYIFCIDGGGSKTSLQVINPKLEVLDMEQEGKVIPILLAGPTNINIVGVEETKNSLARLLNGLKIGREKQEISEIKDRAAIVCGLAGLASNLDKASVIRDVFISFGFQGSRIALSSDIDLAKQLIIEGEEGAILISGTGSICFSKSLRGEKRVGGYGYALGDEGSGFYIGKLALQAAFKEEFEKEKLFTLTSSICALFKVASVSQVIKLFYSNALKPSDIAKVCPLVFEAAYKQNDKHCLKIIDKSATELAKLVKRATKGATLLNFQVYLQGGVFKNENANNFIKCISTKVGQEHGLEFINISQDNIALLAIRANQ